MAGKITAAFVVFALFALLNFGYVRSNPAIVTLNDPLEICIENCAQCKKMFGPWFDGPLCVESCIESKGNLIPECEDSHSIERFLKKQL